MSDGEQEPGTGVKVHDVEAAEKRYNEASPDNKEAAWLELWHARDFTWRGRSEKAALQTEMVKVPASFPDGREGKGKFKTVSLKDYWRWSVGLPGEERLLTDKELREAGLLAEVEGETYHLIHAPDMGLKVDEQGTPLQILTDIVAARRKRVPEDISIGADQNPNWARALQLLGVWLPGGLLWRAGTETAVRMSGARISDVDFQRQKFGPLHCVQSLFAGEANFWSATFFGGARFGCATFSGWADFEQARFSGEANFWSATFFGGARFGCANFRGRANFEQATFKDSLTFEDGTFESVVTFRDVNWSKTNSPNAFRRARFKDRADFQAVSVPSISSFNEAHFELAPSFTDPAQSQINEIFRDAIRQMNASIDKAFENKPKAIRKENEKAIKDELLNALEGGFRTLKKVAEEKGNFLLSQAYYRFEVKTRVRRPSIPFWEKVAATFYGLSSDYGNSIARPFVSLAVILAGFAAIYLAGFAAIYLALAIQVNLVDWQDRQALQSGFLQSLDFSLTNVFQPLSALSADTQGEGEASSLAEKLLNNYGKGFGLIVTAISIIQSFTGIVLAFLFALAVRRRFQIS